MSWRSQTGPLFSGDSLVRAQCLQWDFIPRVPQTTEVAGAAGWPVPTTEERGTEFDGAAPPQKSPFC